MSGARVLLLDLFARNDGFVGDAALAELGAELVQRGHHVELVRSVLADDGGADAATWHGRIADLLGRRAFDVVVLPRVWDPATIESLRGAITPNVLLVRLTNGVAARLDDRFDRVLDVAGLIQLLDGDTDVPAAAWRKTSAAKLRALPIAKVGEMLTVWSLDDLADGAAADRGPSGRPTLSGPASGCPFLLDAAKNPIFAKLALDPNEVQTRGCTFCLDNTGAFAARSEAEVLDAWLGQLRRERARRPAAREFLLTDERPHPYLPAFFRAVRDQGLGPVELLMKTRVDWLLEHAGGAMAEAAAIAEESGSVLHVYLVGFESFEPFHLELFNKGVTVADNVAAVEKLRELEARFPQSFEHKRYRAHGIVLFTPWTRPEHLLENARVMREVRFHELRSEAVRTRLRLYPRVPLHALAAADGLLVDRFEEGRADRAAEQGYDASVPWRFQDPRMEAIFRVATGLAARDRTLPDADVIEAATRFILRWPGLAAAPEVAFLPMDQALRIWAPGPGNPAAATSGFDPEIDLIAAGAKRACLKEAVPGGEAADLVRAYRAMGLAAEVVERHGLASATDAHHHGDAFAIVAVAADDATLAEVLEAQRSHRQRRAGDDDPTAIMGALMGYPACCVRAFSAQADRNDNLENERLTLLRAPAAVLHPLLNRLGEVRLVSHHLCAADCAASASIAEAVMARLGSISPAAAEWARAEIAAPTLCFDYERRVRLQGAFEGGEFVVTDAAPIHRTFGRRRDGVDVREIARISLSPRGVAATLRDGRRVEIPASRPILVIPGQALPPQALAALAPQGAPALPAAIRPGVRVLAYQILAVHREGRGHRVTLVNGAHRFDLRVWQSDAGPREQSQDEAAVLRRGRWSIAVTDPESLPDPARAALTLVARALPA